MTKQDAITAEKPAITGLDLLRQPFPPHQISKLPKPTRKQTDDVKADFKKGIRCNICGAWHHKDVVHLDYVGHAALTDRLLDSDPKWNWEPLAFTQTGMPATDENGGMWIRLTVCGVTRYGYGHPDGKKGGDAIKELIGDALRNAAMRFGAALDLWHKGDLHGLDDEPTPPFNAHAATGRICGLLAKATSLNDLRAKWKAEKDTIADIRAADPTLFDEIDRAAHHQKAQIEKQAAPAITDDEIPY